MVFIRTPKACHLSNLLTFVVCALSSCISFTANCQKIDSLESLLPYQKGLQRATLLYQLAYEHIDVDNTQAKIYAGEAYNMAKAYGDSLLIVRSGRIGALALARLDEQDSSIDVSLQILPIAKRNNFEVELKHILNRLGGGYSYNGNYDMALTYHFESLALREKTGDKFDIAVTLHNIGFVYYNLDDFDKALSFFNRSLEYREKVENKYDLDILLVNISLVYVYKGQLDLADAFLKRAFDLCGNNCSKKFLTSAYYNLGMISMGRGDLDKARSKFLESYSLAKEIDNTRFEIDNMVNLLQLARKKGSVNMEKDLISEAEALLAESMKYPVSLIDLYSELFQTYGMLQNLEKKSFYQSKYIQLEDSVFSTGLTKNLMKVEAEYMERENKAKLEAQGKILALTNDIIERQRTINVVIGIVAVLSAGFVILLVETVRQKKHANVRLEEKVFERTIQLENQHNLLRKSLQEREIQLERMTNDIRSSLATIKGLGLLVLHDVNMLNASTYVDKIEETSNSLLEGLNSTKPTGFEK